MRKLCMLMLITSTLLAVIVLPLFFSSYWRGIRLVRERDLGRAWSDRSITFARGRVIYEHHIQSAYAMSAKAPRAIALQLKPDILWEDTPFFDVRANHGISPLPGVKPGFVPTRFRVIFPIPLLLFLFLVSPAIWLISLLLKPKPGHCIKCGYDLRGSPSGPCPECGAQTLSIHWDSRPRA